MAAPTGCRCFQRTIAYLHRNSNLSKGHLKTEHALHYHWQYCRTLSLSTSNFQQISNDKASSEGKRPLKKPYTPVGKHDDTSEKHRDAEKEPLEAFPDDINPVTGERGGPKGPEPTRYGDWERKGRCIDF